MMSSRKSDYINSLLGHLGTASIWTDHRLVTTVSPLLTNSFTTEQLLSEDLSFFISELFKLYRTAMMEK
jgi:hypothetical protein